MVGPDVKHQITQIKGISFWVCLCSCLHTFLFVCTSCCHGAYVCEHVHTFVCVWVGMAAAYSLRLPAPPRWWLPAAISFLSEWVYNPCYNAVIIQYAYICLASTKHVWSQSNSSASAVYLISLYYIITQGPLVAAFIRRAFTVLWVQTWQHRTPIPGSVLVPRYTFWSFSQLRINVGKTHTHNYCSRKQACVWAGVWTKRTEGKSKLFPSKETCCSIFHFL